MPRRETELPADETGPVVQFARALRYLRHRAGSPTYREMGRRTHYSHTALSRAAGGKRLPSWEVTRAFVTACEDDPSRWRGRHDRAVRSTSPRPDGLSGKRNRRPGSRDTSPSRGREIPAESFDVLITLAEELVQDPGPGSTPASLAMRLRVLKDASGLSIRQIARITERDLIADHPCGPLEKIPVSTIGDLLDQTRTSWPSPGALRSFLVALRAPALVVRTIVKAVEVARGSGLPVPAHVARRITELFTVAEARAISVDEIETLGLAGLLGELAAIDQTADSRLIARLQAEIGALLASAVDPAAAPERQCAAAFRQGRLASSRPDWLDALRPPG
ncbi:helix-turn-helix transcriptional regulator [Phytomonospora sp. NPDC050363]|uniref:helix-turn-helix domain-containing protein n=1 Tax=Phytomonospora sp. NPDC050363 TaxID=3155642 RepID=UPI0033D658F6